MKSLGRNIILTVAGWLILLFVMSGCTNEIPASRVNSQEAEQLIEAYIRTQNPSMSETATFPVEEITPDNAWETLLLQVYKVKEGVQVGEAYIIEREEVIHIGTAFGGPGVTNMVVSDLDSDGSPELLFTYGFGSGIHRMRIGAYLHLYSGITVEECDIEYRGDIQLVKNEEGKIEVEIIDGNEPIMLGTLALMGVEEEKKLLLILRDGLPDEIFDKVWYVQ